MNRLSRQTLLIVQPCKVFERRPIPTRAKPVEELTSQKQHSTSLSRQPRPHSHILKPNPHAANLPSLSLLYRAPTRHRPQQDSHPAHTRRCRIRSASTRTTVPQLRAWGTTLSRQPCPAPRNEPQSRICQFRCCCVAGSWCARDHAACFFVGARCAGRSGGRPWSAAPRRGRRMPGVVAGLLDAGAEVRGCTRAWFFFSFVDRLSCGRNGSWNFNGSNRVDDGGRFVVF